MSRVSRPEGGDERQHWQLATGCGQDDEAVIPLASAAAMPCGQLIDYNTASVDCCCHHWWSIEFCVIFISQNNRRDLFFVGQNVASVSK